MNRSLSVTDALFGDLPPEARERFGLPEPASPSRSSADSGEPKPDLAVRTGDGPDTPTDLSWSSWKHILKRVYGQISEDRVSSVAGGMTFFGLLALFPAITAFVSIFGLVADRSTITRLTGMMERFMPGEAATLIEDQINSILDAPSQSLSIALIISILAALYSAMGGAKSLIGGLNIAWFEQEKRGFLQLNLIALAFTLGAIALLGLMIAVIAVVPVVLGWFPLGELTETLVAWLRWPITFGVLLVALAAIYRWGPAKTDPAWQWITPGALFAAVGLIVASLLFSWYAANFGSYNKTYGSLGAVVVLMMWLWIASIVVLIGAELNSEVERQIAKENGVSIGDENETDSA